MTHSPLAEPASERNDIAERWERHGLRQYPRCGLEQQWPAREPQYYRGLRGSTSLGSRIRCTSRSLSAEEAQLVTKVEEPMRALEQVKRYRALARLMVDFAMIMLLSASVLPTWELAVNSYRLATSFYRNYATPGLYTRTASSGTGSPFPQLFAGLSLIVIPAIGLLMGNFWVDRRLKLVKVGEWKDSLKEGFPGAVKLLQELKWDAVFEDIRVSKTGYALYFAIEVVGYWILAFIVLFFPYGLGMSVLHLSQPVHPLLPFLSSSSWC
jgi:hypothetical protein